MWEHSVPCMLWAPLFKISPFPANGSQIHRFDLGLVVSRFGNDLLAVGGVGLLARRGLITLKWNVCALAFFHSWESVHSSGCWAQVRKDGCSWCLVFSPNSKRHKGAVEQNGCFPVVREVSVGAIMYEQLCLLWNIDSSFHWSVKQSTLLHHCVSCKTLLCVSSYRCCCQLLNVHSCAKVLRHPLFSLCPANRRNREQMQQFLKTCSNRNVDAVNKAKSSAFSRLQEEFCFSDVEVRALGRIHPSIRPVATDFQSTSCVIWHSSALRRASPLVQFPQIF